MVARVPRDLRRTVFGRDPAGYARARLSYPPRLYRILEDRCGLGPGASVFEVGPGTGIATRELLVRGVDRLTLVEADPRLARYLRRTLRAGRTDLTILESPFERARLAPARFDLGLAASSFHWVPPRAGLRRVARALRPGGWWASWNNHHGDPYRPDRFQRALEALYEDRRPSSRARASTAAEEATARRREAAGGRRRLALLRAQGAFERIRRDDLRWRVVLDTRQIVGLWSTFSDTITLRPTERTRFLHGLAELVDREFGGTATLRMLTPLYTARRRSDARGRERRGPARAGVSPPRGAGPSRGISRTTER